MQVLPPCGQAMLLHASVSVDGILRLSSCDYDHVGVHAWTQWLQNMTGVFENPDHNLDISAHVNAVIGHTTVQGNRKRGKDILEEN